MKKPRKMALRLALAKTILDQYGEIAANLPANLSLQTFTSVYTDAVNAMTAAEQAATASSQAVIQRQNADQALGTMLTGLKRAVSGAFGDNSSAYELVGGKRRANFKHAVKRTKAPVAPVSGEDATASTPVASATAAQAAVEPPR